MIDAEKLLTDVLVRLLELILGVEMTLYHGVMV
jgi:hypothetical protein